MLHSIVVLLLIRLTAGDFLDDSQAFLTEFSRFVVPLCNESAYYWRSTKWKASEVSFASEDVCGDSKASNVLLTPICEGYPGKLIPVMAGYVKTQKWEQLINATISGNHKFVKVYECVDGHKVTPMKVAEGCWSDRLVGRGVCRSESSWLARATEDCGQAPVNFTILTQCGTRKFLEIEYVCCNNVTRLDAADHFENHRKITSSVHSTALAILKEFSSLNHRLDSIFTKSEAEINDLSKEFGVVSLPSPPFFTPLIKEYLLNWIVGKTPDIDSSSLNITELNKESILSRRTHWHKIALLLHQISYERNHNLFHAAFTLATDEEQRKALGTLEPQQLLELSNLRRFDVEEVLKHFEIVTALDVTVFPELKDLISSTWLDYCMTHTWGIPEAELRTILKAPHAHSQILQRYHKIFADAARDEPVDGSKAGEQLNQAKEFSQTKVVLSVVAVTLFLVAMLFIAMVKVECCAFKVKQFKNEKIDHFVRFGSDDQDVSVEFK